MTAVQPRCAKLLEVLLAGFVKSLLTIWRIAMPYFCSGEQRRARILLIAVIAMELGLVPAAEPRQKRLR